MYDVYHININKSMVIIYAAAGVITSDSVIFLLLPGHTNHFIRTEHVYYVTFCVLFLTLAPSYSAPPGITWLYTVIRLVTYTTHTL